MTITKSRIIWGGVGARKIVSRPVRMPGVLIHAQAQVLVFVDHRKSSISFKLVVMNLFIMHCKKRKEIN